MKPAPEIAHRLAYFLADAEIAFRCAAFVAFFVAARVVFAIAKMAARNKLLRATRVFAAILASLAKTHPGT